MQSLFVSCLLKRTSWKTVYEIYVKTQPVLTFCFYVRGDWLYLCNIYFHVLFSFLLFLCVLCVRLNNNNNNNKLTSGVRGRALDAKWFPLFQILRRAFLDIGPCIGSLPQREQVCSVIFILGRWRAIFCRWMVVNVRVIFSMRVTWQAVTLVDNFGNFLM